MSFWDDITAFGEGAWESVTTGAQNALGEWATGWSGAQTGAAGNGQANAGQSGGNGNIVTTAQPGNTGSNSSGNAGNADGSAGYGHLLTKENMLIGGGLLLGLVLILK